MQPNLNPTPQSVYSHKSTLNEAITYIQGQLPVSDPNEMYALLMLYHNTLLLCQEASRVDHTPNQVVQESR